MPSGIHQLRVVQQAQQHVAVMTGRFAQFAQHRLINGRLGDQTQGHESLGPVPGHKHFFHQLAKTLPCHVGFPVMALIGSQPPVRENQRELLGAVSGMAQPAE